MDKIKEGDKNMRNLVIALLLLASCAQVPKKIEPDKVVQMDGDFIAGCVSAIAIMVVNEGHQPDMVNIEAHCMDLYLKWLELKNGEKEANNRI